MEVICSFIGEGLTWALSSVPLTPSPVVFPNTSSDYVIVCLIGTSKECPNTEGIHVAWANVCKSGLVNIYVPNLWFAVVNKYLISQ